MSDIEGKNIWITGASSGIGREIAIQLAEFKPYLILSARDINALEIVASQCRNKGAKITVLPLDLVNTTEVTSVDKLLTNTVDILIYSAGISQRSMALDSLIDVDRQLMEINFFAAVALSKCVLHGMCKRKHGHIVIISSVVGKFGTPMRSGYSASKHAVHGYFDSLRAELHHKGIKVTLVCPGYIQTNITLRSLTADGSPYNKIDQSLEHGIPVDRCAHRIIKGILKNEHEFIVSGIKEYAGVLIKRFFPHLFSFVVRVTNPIN